MDNDKTNNNTVPGEIPETPAAEDAAKGVETNAHDEKKSASAPPIKTNSGDGKASDVGSGSGSGSDDGKKKKLLTILLPVIGVIVVAAIVIAVVMINKSNKDRLVFVTDENGVAITDENGKPITVMPETEVVNVTDMNGETVTGIDGAPLTTTVYKPIEVKVPVTDMNGTPVTDKSGAIVTESITITPAFETGGNTGRPSVVGSSAVVVTDGQGNSGLDEQGNVITTIVNITSLPAADIEPAKTEWKATQGGLANDYYSDVEQLADGGYIASNVANSFDGDFAKFKGLSYIAPYTVLTKYDKAGNTVWQNAVGGTKGTLQLSSLAAAKDGGFFAAGWVKNLDGKAGYGYYDGIVMKFDKNGKREWAQTFGTSTVDLFNGIDVTDDGGVVAVGSVGNNDKDAAGFGGKELNSRAAIVKYSSDGKLVWKNIVGGNMDTFTGVAVGKDGSIFTVGNFYSGTLFKSAVAGKADSGIAKFTSGGKYTDIFKIAGSGVESFNGITVTKDGGIAVVGRSNSSDTDSSSFFSGDTASRGKYDAYIIKVSAKLELMFATPFRGQNDDSLVSVIEMSNGTLLAAGYTNSSSRDLKGVTTRGGDDIVIAAFASDGERLWARSFGGTVADSSTAICEASDGGYVVVGKTVSKDVDLASIAPYALDGKTVGVIVKFPE